MSRGRASTAAARVGNPAWPAVGEEVELYYNNVGVRNLSFLPPFLLAKMCDFSHTLLLCSLIIITRSWMVSLKKAGLLRVACSCSRSPEQHAVRSLCIFPIKVTSHSTSKE